MRRCFFWVIGLAAVLGGCATEKPKDLTQESPQAQSAIGIPETVPPTVAVNCGDSTSQTSMNECFAREAEHDQQLLDALLKELGDKLDPAETGRLQGVQLEWTKYRDSHCHWQAGFSEGGSIQPTVYSTCISALTWNRIDELKVDLCEGAGLTGPCEASKRYDRRGLSRMRTPPVKKQKSPQR